ncbi:MAG: hypothetical protein ACRYF2_23380 [Janthinobacterium lividum]
MFFKHLIPPLLAAVIAVLPFSAFAVDVTVIKTANTGTFTLTNNLAV